MAKKVKGGKKAPKAKKKTAARTPARQPSFTGMEQIRNAKLDRLCESIGDARERGNKAKQDETEDAQAALSEMLRKDLHGYVHMGVRLTAKRGVDKLGIALVKDKSEQGAQPGSAAEAEPEDDGGRDNSGEIDEA